MLRLRFRSDRSAVDSESTESDRTRDRDFVRVDFGLVKLDFSDCVAISSVSNLFSRMALWNTCLTCLALSTLSSPEISHSLGPDLSSSLKVLSSERVAAGEVDEF